MMGFLMQEPMKTLGFVILFLVFNSTLALRAKGPRWWKLPYTVDDTTFLSNEILSNSLSDHHLPEVVQVLLRKKQRRLARENQGVLLAVSNGTQNAMHECRHQFKNRRWNCQHLGTGKDNSPYGKIISIPCRETAFVYAMTAASVLHAVTRGCTEGTIQSCSCDYKPQHTNVAGYHPYKPHPNIHLLAPSQNDVHHAKAQTWQWGGCSENIEFGYRFSKEFVDAGEKGRDLRSILNLHNNEVGRKHVKSLMRRKCKCHGMSGSCTVKSCWLRLPHLRKIGDTLKERFDGASRVKGTKEMLSRTNDRKRSTRKTRKKKRKSRKFSSFKAAYGYKFPTKKDIVYSHRSPDFCHKNKKIGYSGTQGRTCNVTSNGLDGCELMCCGRGYTTQVRQVQEMCNCTFHWCCEVKCKTCTNTKVINSCR